MESVLNNAFLKSNRRTSLSAPVNTEFEKQITMNDLIFDEYALANDHLIRTDQQGKNS